MAPRRRIRLLLSSSESTSIDSLNFLNSQQPNSTMAFMYAARTDKEFPKCRDFFQSKCSGFAVREVSGDNEHWHWFLRSDTRINSLRELLRRSVPEIAGNRGYSLKVCDDADRYMQYMCKGDGPDMMPEVVWKVGLDLVDTKFQELHEAYWVENRQARRQRRMTVSEKVLEAAKAANVAWDDVRQLSRLYLKELRAQKKAVNLFACKAAIRGLQLQLCPDDSAIEDLSAQLFIQ